MKKFIVEGAITGTIYLSEAVHAKTPEEAFEKVKMQYDEKFPFDINFSELEVNEVKEPMQLKVYFELYETDEEAKKIDNVHPIKRVGIWNKNFNVPANIFEQTSTNKYFDVFKCKMEKAIEWSIFDEEEEKSEV